MSVCNLLCDGDHSCVTSSIDIDECQSSQIICNGPYSCNNMKVAVHSASNDVLNLHCGVETSCANLELNVFGNAITSTSCIGLNACDGLTINANPHQYTNSKLQMFAYSSNA
eukprot:295472_1